MLSPGNYYKSVPKDRAKNAAYRLYILKRSRNRRYRQALLAMCEQDFFFWLNTFGWQFNPDKREVGPFITWDRQPWMDAIPDQQTQEEAVREVLDAVEAREDVRWQKSREVGASWLVLFVIVWLCIFHKNVAALAMSRHEKAVDDPDDPDSLFWKVRFIHAHLPAWMVGPIKNRAKGQGRLDPRPGIREKSNGFVYERTHSFFNGTANTKDAGVGGRKTIALVDEFGQFMNGHETYSMTSDTANCRVFVFTHKEDAGMAYDLCFDAKYVAMRSIVTHWTQHPQKGRGCYRYDEERNAVVTLDKKYAYPPTFDFVLEAKPTGGPFPFIRSPWYDRQCIRRTERDVSMNLDINPRGASEKFFDTYRIRVLKAEFCGTGPCWTGSITYDKERGIPKELVEDRNGLVKLWVQPRSLAQIACCLAGAAVDIAAGTGATPSCLSVMNAKTGEKFLEYANALIYANEFAVFVVALLRMIEDRNGSHPLLGWEIQGGQVFDRKVRELGYGPCYVNRNEDKLGKPRNEGGVRGVNTHGVHIMPVMENYRDALYDRSCINRSEYALDETLRFVYSGKWVEYRGPKKPRKTGEEGSMATVHHGDIVKADAIAYKMIKELGFDGPEIEETKRERIDPRTFDGRVRLAEMQRDEEEEVAWQ